MLLIALMGAYIRCDSIYRLYVLYVPIWNRRQLFYNIHTNYMCMYVPISNKRQLFYNIHTNYMCMCVPIWNKRQLFYNIHINYMCIYVCTYLE